MSPPSGVLGFGNGASREGVGGVGLLLDFPVARNKPSLAIEDCMVVECELEDDSSIVIPCLYVLRVPPISLVLYETLVCSVMQAVLHICDK